MGTPGILALIIGSGGIGALITLLLNIKNSKRIKSSEANSAETHADKDRFESLMLQCNNLMKDYTSLSEMYREALDESNKKCQLLADLRAQIQYLKGLRCYNTECPYRIKLNPEKLK